MNRFQLYPVLFITSLLLFLKSFFSMDKTFVLSIYDTYYVIQENHFFYLMAAFFGFLFLLYAFLHYLKIQMIQFLTWAHSIVSVGALMGLLYSLYKDREDLMLPRYYLFTDSPDYNFWALISFFSLLLVQIVLVINIFVAVIRKNSTPQ